LLGRKREIFEVKFETEHRIKSVLYINHRKAGNIYSVKQNFL